MSRADQIIKEKIEWAEQHLEQVRNLVPLRVVIDELGVSYETARKLVSEGPILGIREEGHWLADRVTLDEYKKKVGAA